jgi:prepilin-type N-terminal cleavage/methylation domain-containing protein
MRGDRGLHAVHSPWKCLGHSSAESTETGFTLIELLIVIVILPIVIGAITVALISVFKLQNATFTSLNATGDAQIVSANFVNDVQSSSSITTDGSSTNPAPCGLSGSSVEVVSLKWLTSEVSYVETPDASGFSLVRNLCQGATTTRTVLSDDVPSGLKATITCASQPPTVAAECAGTPPPYATGWVSAAGVSGVNLTIIESGSHYTDNLTAVPRISTPTSSNQAPPVQPILPLELLGDAGAACTPPPAAVLTLSGGSSITVGGGTGILGMASPCPSSITLSGSATLSATLVTSDPGLNSVSTSGGAKGPSSETLTSGGVLNPFASLVAPANPATAGMGAGSCSTVSGKTTCSTGLYGGSLTFDGDSVDSFVPTSAPVPNVFVFNQPVSISGGATVTFGPVTGNVTAVTYWFRGGLTISGGGSANFGPATYVFGDSKSPPANALNISGGATINANSGVLFYVEAGPADFSGGTNTPIAGTSQYDGIAIWDASTSTFTLGGGGSILDPIGGVYDPSGNIDFSGGTALVTSFVVANTATGSGSGAVTITGADAP